MLSAPTNAVLRHGYTAAGAVTATLAVIGILQGDATSIGVAVQQIGEGIAKIVAGIGTLAAIASAAYAASTGTRTSQVAGVAAMPGTAVSPDGKTITIVDHELAVAAKEAATPVRGA